MVQAEQISSRVEGDATELRSGDTANTERIVQTLSNLMDSAFTVPILGWRFGWDAVIGLVPAVGDAATTLVSLYIVALAGWVGLPRVTIARMGLNLAIDMVLGSFPFVGDLFDVYWKANLRNAALLRERLAIEPDQRRQSTPGDWIFVAAVLVGLLVLFLALVALVALGLATLWRLVFG